MASYEHGLEFDAYQEGIKTEQSRILELIEAHPLFMDIVDSPICWVCNDTQNWDDHIKALIKGENNG